MTKEQLNLDGKDYLIFLVDPQEKTIEIMSKIANENDFISGLITAFKDSENDDIRILFSEILKMTEDGRK